MISVCRADSDAVPYPQTNFASTLVKKMIWGCVDVLSDIYILVITITTKCIDMPCIKLDDLFPF